MDNKWLSTKEGIGIGITWTINDFQQKKGLELELHGLKYNFSDFAK